MVGALVLVILALTAHAGAFVPGYELTSIENLGTMLVGNLSQIAGSQGPYGGDLPELSLFVYFESDTTLRVRITDPLQQRWEVPGIVQADARRGAEPEYGAMYNFTYTENPFGFAVVRVSDGSTIFNTSYPTNAPSGLVGFNGLIFEDQYIELSTQLPLSPAIYGLGERKYTLRLPANHTTYTIWNRDHETPVLENLYGTHPFYLDLRPGGVASGVCLLNSNAMDIYLQPGALTYKTIGGVIDLYFVLGPSPSDVIAQYHALIGLPHMPPYWSLGFHQCRWGYFDLIETRDVVTKYAEAKIPLDTMWNDIDYMDLYKDFTTSPIRFNAADMQRFVAELHASGQHYVSITDPGIKNLPGYAPYDDGLKAGIFIMDAAGKEPEVGRVWPGHTVFPDFFHPGAQDYWTTQIQNFRDNFVAVDGMWIDMNEISSFCDGNCTDDESVVRARVIEDLEGAGNGTTFDPNHPPYVPGSWYTNGPLYTRTIDLAARSVISLEYNAHSLYGFSESVATMTALEQLTNKRSLVITRSTFAGSGHYVGHWLGDNHSTYQDLYWSIPGILAMNMFGIPLVGADICGFNGDTTEELCTRWIQVGAFYPFSRDHNAIFMRPQELYVWPQVANVSRTVLGIRYSLLPYYYTLFVETHLGGGTVARSLMLEFAADENAWDIDRQFLIGPAFMISPVLDEGATSVVAYFPAGVWYDFYTGAQLAGVPSSGAGVNVTLDAPITFVPLHVRGGYVIPIQGTALTTTAGRLNPFSLLVALNSSGQAAGTFVTDDGESLTNLAEGNFTSALFNAWSSAGNGGVTSTVLTALYVGPDTAVWDTVTVLGVALASTPDVTVNGDAWNDVVYEQASQKLTVSGLHLQPEASFSIEWSGN